MRHVAADNHHLACLGDRKLLVADHHRTLSAPCKENLDLGMLMPHTIHRSPDIHTHMERIVGRNRKTAISGFHKNSDKKDGICKVYNYICDMQEFDVNIIHKSAKINNRKYGFSPYICNIMFNSYTAKRQ